MARENVGARAALRLLLIAVALLAGACGKKGPLYLPDEARAAPPVLVAALGDARGREVR